MVCLTLAELRDRGGWCAKAELTVAEEDGVKRGEDCVVVEELLGQR
jgi:hypothetical protein